MLMIVNFYGYSTAFDLKKMGLSFHLSFCL